MLRRGSGIFAPAIAAPSRDAVCLAHFLSGGMWLSDRNDAELYNNGGQEQEICQKKRNFEKSYG